MISASFLYTPLPSCSQLATAACYECEFYIYLHYPQFTHPMLSLVVRHCFGRFTTCLSQCGPSVFRKWWPVCYRPRLIFSNVMSSACFLVICFWLEQIPLCIRFSLKASANPLMPFAAMMIFQKLHARCLHMIIIVTLSAIDPIGKEERRGLANPFAVIDKSERFII